MDDLTRALAAYGAPPDQVVALTGRLSPQTLRYAEIMKAPRDRPDAVVEDPAGIPVAYVGDRRTVAADGEDLARLRRAVAYRGDASFLVVVHPGRLDVFETELGAAGPADRPGLRVLTGAEGAFSTFARLRLAPDRAPGRSKSVRDAVFELMTGAIDTLQRGGLPTEDALSLVGRAVFTRFLVDRGLLTEAELSAFAAGRTAEQVFDGPEVCARTCSWLDETFNGDFLPLSFPATQAELRRRVADDGWSALADMLRAAPGRQYSLDRIGWGALDFARIPVGVLSQVYERQARTHAPAEQRRKSVYYTPRFIADFMIAEVFAALDEREAETGQPADRARVLDPAVGGGVFLVAAFRELVARRWRREGREPDTEAIRRILMEQLAGLDVEPAALRLTALSLYLTAIELDPDPSPLQRLRFEQLDGRVLHHVGGPGLRGRTGSLGSHVSPAHRGGYDVVIGNPPWTVERIDRQAREDVVRTLRPIVAGRLGAAESAAFDLPDANPDAAFLWRAVEWARPGGLIALVTHARLLFKQSEPGRRARAALLGALRVTSFCNGAALRETLVWPGVKAPFVIAFACNERPSADDEFLLFSPLVEQSLNRRGRFRIDAKDAQPVRLSEARERPWLAKALFRCTRLDAALLPRVEEAGPDLERYWTRVLRLELGQGYRVAERSGRRDARFLQGYPDVTKAAVGAAPRIPCDALPRFDRSQLCRPRRPEIYRGPLALVRETFLTDTGEPRVYVCDGHAAYSESFHGFSAHGHRDGHRLVRYLQLLLTGPLFEWYVLLTSGKYGVERTTMDFQDLKRFPVPPLDGLSEAQRRELDGLSDRYAEGDPGFADAHRRWLGELYGLAEWDWRVVEDTVATAAPQNAVVARAQQAPSPAESEAFRADVARILTTTLGRPVAVRPVDGGRGTPWAVLAIEGARSADGEGHVSEDDVRRLLAVADENAASLVHIRPRGGPLLVAVLRQRRFWTRSRARLLAVDLLRELGTDDREAGG